MRYESDRSGGHDVTQLLERVAAGDSRGESELFQLVYGQLRRIAGQRMRNERPGHTLQATALVHEADLRLFRDETPRLRFSERTVMRDWAYARAWLRDALEDGQAGEAEPR